MARNKKISLPNDNVADSPRFSLINADGTSSREADSDRDNVMATTNSESRPDAEKPSSQDRDKTARKLFKYFRASSMSGAPTTSTNKPASIRSDKSGESKKPKEKGKDKEKEKEKDKDKPKEPAGMNCEFKNLYSGPEDKKGRYKWQESPPEDIGEAVENEETAKFALIVRNVKVYNDPRRVLKVHSVVVQSPLIKDLLKPVLKDYPGVTTNLQRLELSGKFEPIIHRWPQLTEAIKNLKDEQTKKHAELFYNILEKEFKDVISESLDMKKNGVMSYDLLWTLFQPGEIIYSKVDGQDCAFKFLNGRYGRNANGDPVYWLICQFVEFDGNKFGNNKLNIQVSEFVGNVNISELTAYPLEFHQSKEELKKKLLDRGTRVEKLKGCNYQAYTGTGWKKNMWGKKEKYNVNGRIVVDADAWNKYNMYDSVYVTPFGQSQTSSFPSGIGDADDDDNNPDDRTPSIDMPFEGVFPDSENQGSSKALTEEQKLICGPLVRGYSLSTKMWLSFFVNDVKDIQFNEDAFSRLVLPTQQKELVLGFTESQREFKGAFDDHIEGKGKGIILLLMGPPGTGKTLTSESVAEEMRVPLYSMSAGDLGSDPSTAENKLQDVLDICQRWSAVLLIDEADVLLEERSLHELQRNSLVSLFLRVLEYYEGIMFLTTNRVETFDPAFQSRIHISLDYPELTTESRHAIWRNFINPDYKKGGESLALPAIEKEPSSDNTTPAIPTPASSSDGEKVDVSETAGALEKRKQRGGIPNTITASQLDRLSLIELNGRQIKNVLKTAQLLARRRGKQQVTFDHIKTVLDVTQHLHNQNRETDKQRSAIFM